MRVTVAAGDFRVKAITGTWSLLIALDCREARRHKLLGFAIGRNTGPADGEPRWLNSLKVFRSIVPHPEKERDPQNPDKPGRASGTTAAPGNVGSWLGGHPFIITHP